jgi:type I restriction enzyme S subunit
MIDLNPHHLATVQRILAEHLPGREVRAFGSRATWTAWEYSDLDLAVVSPEPLDWRERSRIREAFEESDLPIRVDVVDWDGLSDSFRQAIDGDCVVVQEAAPSSGWRETTLGEVIQINPKRQLERGSEAPFVAMADVLEHQRELQELGTREFKGSGSRFSNGDTLLARITPCLENGKTAWVSGLADDEIGHGSTEFIVLSAKEGITDPRFVYYLSRHPKFRSYAIGQMTGPSGRQRVPVSAVESYELPLPPLDEQRRIARILGALDDKIELNRRICQTLEAMAQALFKSWFVDFDPVRAKANGQPTNLPPDIDALFPDAFQDSELGEIPLGWEVFPAGEAMTVLGGSTPSTKEPTYWNGEHCFATPKDLSLLQSPVLTETARNITKAGVDKIRSRLLPKGTVLLSSRAPIGYLALTEVPVAINQGIIAMVCDGSVGAPYAVHWARANMLAIENRAGGTTFAEISKSAFREIPFLAPPESVHTAWDLLARPAHDQLAELARQSRALVAQRASLLPHLMGVLP